LSPACGLFFGMFLPGLSMSIVSYRSDRLVPTIHTSSPAWWHGHEWHISSV
jgi:hypothetical protein